MKQIVAAEMNDVARVAPVLEHARDDREKHMIPAVVAAHHVGRPMRELVPRDACGQFHFSLANVRPIRASVRALRDADRRGVNPRDSEDPGGICAAVRVEHPPALDLGIPDDDGVRRTVINRIAKQRLRGDGVRSLAETYGRRC